MSNLSENTKLLQNWIKLNHNLEDISEKEISKIYQELIDCITDHNHLYYINSSPIISDVEYDKLFWYLQKIEQNFPYIISWNSPTQKLVNQIQEWFDKAEHKAPMLSLENSYNAKDLEERDQRINKILEKIGKPYELMYYVEPKFDWLSIELIYKDWEFKQAITRWDWLIWEDVTENVKTIKNIPKKLQWNLWWTISFRGEILIWKSELEKRNIDRKKKWLQIYANTRNLASWSLKQLDPNITASRNLQCFVYEILYSDTNEILNIQNLWLPTYPEIKSSNSIKDIIKICENLDIKQQLKKEDIEFDGLVIKISSGVLRKQIWSTAHHPRRAIAYKFPAEQVSTQIKSVEFQVWRTWIITPVANLEPVNLSGATISRVSLHNFDFIKEKDIHYNDFVRLQRSWEVIPYIVWSIKERRNNIVPLTKGDKGGSKLITAPENCPSCWTILTPVDMHYYCQNSDCSAQIKEKIIRFVSKNCMDIEWIWENIVEILVNHNIIQNISDLYKLQEFETERVIRRFPWFADKKIVEIQKQLQESKNREFRRLLNWLWIPGIWKKTAKDISNELGIILTKTEISKNKNRFLPSQEWQTNLKQISKYLTNPEFLIWIYWIGEKIVEWLINYRNNNKVLLKKLEHIWLNFDCTNNKSEKQKFKWKFCITWSFDIPRPEIIKKMEENWFIFDWNPNKTTNYILIWSKPWSKLSKAEEFWIKIITSWDKITKKFPFLLEIQINKTKNSGPEQLWLF